MRRRTFLKALGGAALVGPFACGDDGADDAPVGSGFDGGVASDAGQVADGPAPGDGATTNDGASASDGAAASDAATSATWDARYDAALGAIPSDAKWVSTTGSDSAAGTQAAPFKTIKKALRSISGGGQVVIEDGTYEGADNWINEITGPVPSGTAGKRTIIRAKNRFGVRIVQSARPSGYYESIVYLGPSSSYVWIDGIVAETTWAAAAADDNASATVWDDGTHNRLTRILVKKSSCSRYGGAFAYGRGALLEDCHAVGSGRYMFFGGTGGDSAPAGAAVLRRCTSTMHFGPALEPSASFCFYGSNDGSYAECKDVLFANCYEIDSPHLVGADADAVKWGSAYLPKSVRNVRFIGCGSLGSGAEYAAFRTDNYGGASDTLASFVDCFVWGFTNGSPATAAAFGKASNGVVTADHCTTGSLPGPVNGGGVTATNMLSAGVVHPVARVSGAGAEQRFAVGAFLSAWGDAGFDVPDASLPLWPFPYEADLAKLAAEPLTKPTTDKPTGVTSAKNPYAGNAKDGSPMTLTKRIWEAAGTAMPPYASIYP